MHIIPSGPCLHACSACSKKESNNFHLIVFGRNTTTTTPLASPSAAAAFSRLAFSLSLPTTATTT